MRKLSARWVPRLLTVDQKRVGMNISNSLLAQFRRNKSEFWRRLDTSLYARNKNTMNHLREKLYCREKHRVHFGQVTEMGASQGEVCRVTRRLC